MPAYHHLTDVKYDDDDGMPTDATVVCTAPTGAWCRMHCPDGCYEWDNDHDTEYGHKLTDAGYCLAVEGFDATDVLESGGAYLAGTETDLTPGPVRVEWSDGWNWYRDDTVNDA